MESSLGFNNSDKYEREEITFEYSNNELIIRATTLTDYSLYDCTIISLTIEQAKQLKEWLSVQIL